MTARCHNEQVYRSVRVSANREVDLSSHAVDGRTSAPCCDPEYAALRLCHTTKNRH